MYWLRTIIEYVPYNLNRVLGPTENFLVATNLYIINYVVFKFSKIY